MPAVPPAATALTARVFAAAAARLSVCCVREQDYNRVSRLAKDLEVEAARRAEDLDRRRRGTAAAEAAVAARIFGVEDNADSAGGGALRGPQQQQLQAQMAEEAINQAIIEETEAELGAINKSLHAVHEIFKDLASMVSQQQEQVEHIEEQTEAAHQRAQQGLAQVQQASHYQPSCSIS
ncbi:hypothetical protein JKP88DRAFT_240698 [Tribonema minus]|uniref:t-SNARE coiled-coil homology domain-containing protein n=1 Tax=Tribonema minus TaxID=303371 RepID=A0A835ZJ40_9STRA|nr:hypothetical protein JKP88DRAFT_240698 [Tribonema minus]